MLSIRTRSTDTCHVDERKNLEEWADALLDQHRTGPPRSAADAPPATAETFAERLQEKLSGEPLDPEMLVRLRRRRETLRRLQAADAIVWMFAAVVAIVFGVVWLSFL